MTAARNPAALLSPGVLVDHFRVVRLVGRGGMGEVYLARDTLLGRRVALKVVRPDALGNRRAAERFFFEAQVTARFSHPHIVGIYAVGEHEGCPYVALEFLEGQTLRERLAEARPSPAEALRIGQAIAEALVEAHANQVLHRDLKPENVVIPRDGRLRVLDFGLAKAIRPAGALPARAEAATPRAPTLATSPGDLPTLQGGADAAVTLASPGGAEDSSLSRTLAPVEDDAETPMTFETVGGGLCGTPLYMAPEQWEELECTPATDVWALGVILYELLSGKRPFDGPSLSALAINVCMPETAPALEASEPLPPALVDLVARCLRKPAAERPAAAEVVAALEALRLHGTGRREAEESPFRGLLPFTERQAETFFGREAEVAAFVERLREEPVLTVVGPSGAGKSSFVQAGVIPRLREQAPWLVLHLRPGSQPFLALATCVVHPEGSSASGGSSGDGLASRTLDLQAVADLAGALRSAPGQLTLRLQQLAQETGRPVLLLVDQLEELLTHDEDAEGRLAFLQAIGEAADDPHEPVRVILTLRDDFLGRAAESAAVRQALSRVAVLRSPGPEALLEILTRPLEPTGYRYEDEQLARDMVQAVQGEAASLPLLQFACSQLWEERDRQARVLRRSVYDEMGGVEGALARQADGVLAGLAPAQLGVARDLLLRLVTPEGTRRVITQEALPQGLGAEADAVLAHLVAERLVVTHQGRGSEAPVAELVHESLIRRWTRLQRWLDEGRDDLVFLAEVSQAADLWEKRGSAPSEAWQGDALAEALRHARRLPTLPPAVQRFLDAGQAFVRRRRRRLQAIIAAALVVLLGFGVVMAVLYRGAETARRSTSLAHERVQLALVSESEARKKSEELARKNASLIDKNDELTGESQKLAEKTRARVLALAHQVKAVLGTRNVVPSFRSFETLDTLVNSALKEEVRLQYKDKVLGFKRIYNQHIRHNSFESKLKVSLDIQADGGLASLKVEGSGPPEFLAAVRAEIASWKLIATGKKYQYTFSVHFSPGTGE